MEILITSIVAFASTNIDDIFLLTLFFGSKRFKDSEIIAGQFLGIISLIAISLAGSLIGLLIDQAYVGLLGLIPIYLGAKGIWRLIRHNDTSDDAATVDEKKSNYKAFTIAGVTIANGGDNIGIYVPLFASLTWTNKLTMVTIFLAMTFVWCMTAKYLTKHPYVEKVIDKYGHYVTPFVLVLLGVYILYENGTMGLLMK